MSYRSDAKNGAGDEIEDGPGKAVYHFLQSKIKLLRECSFAVRFLNLERSYFN